MGMFDVQGVLLVASGLTAVLALIILAAPWVDGRLRREIKTLSGQVQAQRSQLNELNHTLYRTQGIIEEVKPLYERARRLKGAIAEMKKVWLNPTSSDAACAELLRRNLWVLFPEYRDVHVSDQSAGAAISGWIDGGLQTTLAGGGQTVHFRIELKKQGEAEVTRQTLEQALYHASSLRTRAEGGRIECLVIAPKIADGVTEMRQGGEAQGPIDVAPLTYTDLIARAERIANPSLRPQDLGPLPLTEVRPARAA